MSVVPRVGRQLSLPLTTRVRVWKAEGLLQRHRAPPSELTCLRQLAREMLLLALELVDLVGGEDTVRSRSGHGQVTS